MPVTLTITGDTGANAVQEMFSFLGTLHLNLNTAAGIAMPGAAALRAHAAAVVTEPEAKAAEPEKKKAKKTDKEEAKADAPAPKATLQQAIDRAKDIAGDGEDAKVMNALKDLNERFGIAKVRELPPEKLDGYMEELEKAFPSKAAGTGGMFD
jgi:hypothetical protein